MALPHPRRPRLAQRGFTLLEVMVAVLLLTIGIFGFAKMQALAISSTQTASSRSIVAMQANSLAAAMHGGREFWGEGVVARTFSTNGATVTDATGVLTTAGPNNCESATKPTIESMCTPQQIATREVGLWAFNLNALLPGATSLVNCSTRTTTTPVSCVLTIQWNDRYINSTKTAAGTGFGTSGGRSFTLYIEP
ncbi:type IV pilus modification protein PilV [Variovorax robiniae]|uniref:Type IV pilus modification protein PilV n=1 Tax=Variovorax robiniae TaxID=1836199 RepID=A0ABU8X740_9BURK